MKIKSGTYRPTPERFEEIAKYLDSFSNVEKKVRGDDINYTPIKNTDPGYERNIPEIRNMRQIFRGSITINRGKCEVTLSSMIELNRIVKERLEKMLTK